MKNVFKAIAVVALLFVGTAAVRAQDILNPREGKRFYLGALVGANFPTGAYGSDVNPIVGITLGAKLVPMFSIGFYGAYNGQVSRGNFLGIYPGSLTGRFTLTGQADIHISVFHIGMNFGAQVYYWQASSAPAVLGTSTTGFVFGPEVGFDIPLGSFLSLGAEVHYLVTSLLNGEGSVMGAANVKIWL